MKVLHMITFALIVIGGLNWGLVGLFNFDLVAKILGDMTVASKVVYVLVGLSAVWEAATHAKTCRMCGSTPAQPTM